MLISQIIFFTALALIILMIVVRLAYDQIMERNLFGKTIQFIKKVDRFFLDKLWKLKRVVKFFNRKTFVLFGHYVIERAEFYFHKAVKYLKKKLPKK